jgi:uncharacterized Fe-S cluster protein YjdI
MSEKKRVQTYAGDDIVVQFDPNICIHSAACLRNLPAVFDVKRARWIDVKAGNKSDIIAAIAKCPSGALTWTEPGAAAPTVEISANTEVQLIPNGPLRLTGQVRILDAEGKLVMETDKCSLCRCGASENKPFCDGKHRAIGFVG